MFYLKINDDNNLIFFAIVVNFSRLHTKRYAYLLATQRPHQMTPIEDMRNVLIFQVLDFSSKNLAVGKISIIPKWPRRRSPKR
jgi:hypothetical protein